MYSTPLFFPQGDAGGCASVRKSTAISFSNPLTTKQNPGNFLSFELKHGVFALIRGKFFEKRGVVANGY